MDRDERIHEWVKKNSRFIKDAKKIACEKGFVVDEPVELLLIFLEEGLALMLEMDPDHSERPRRCQP